MVCVYLKRSSRSGKKYMIWVDGKTIHFGDAAYEDFTTHGDETRKAKYLARHKRGESWSDARTAGFWSRWLLWNKRTVAASIHDTEVRFGIRIHRGWPRTKRCEEFL